LVYVKIKYFQRKNITHTKVVRNDAYDKIVQPHFCSNGFYVCGVSTVKEAEGGVWREEVYAPHNDAALSRQARIPYLEWSASVQFKNPDDPLVADIRMLTDLY